VQKYVHIYANAKMRPVETIPGMGVMWLKVSNGEGEFKYDLFDTSELCRCHNAPPHRAIKKLKYPR
jgi:hypothetical protein